MPPSSVAGCLARASVADKQHTAVDLLLPPSEAVLGAGAHRVGWDRAARSRAHQDLVAVEQRCVAIVVLLADQDRDRCVERLERSERRAPDRSPVVGCCDCKTFAGGIDDPRAAQREHLVAVWCSAIAVEETITVVVEKGEHHTQSESTA